MHELYKKHDIMGSEGYLIKIWVVSNIILYKFKTIKIINFN